MELAYFLRMRSRRSSTRAVLLMGMSVAEPPGRFTHTFRGSTRAPAASEASVGALSGPPPCVTWSKALRRDACESAGSTGAADMDEVGVARAQASAAATWPRRFSSAAGQSSWHRPTTGLRSVCLGAAKWGDDGSNEGALGSVFKSSKGCISGASRKFDDENENEDAAESRV